MRLVSLLITFLAAAGACSAAASDPGTRPTTSHVVLVERLNPHSKLFGLQILKFGQNNKAEIQQQFLRKNLQNVKDAIGGHIEILESYLKDAQFKPAEAERAKTLLEWMGLFEKEKVFTESVLRFDKLYLRLRQAAASRSSATEVSAQLTVLEKDVLQFAKDEPKMPWALFLVGLTRQLAEVAGYKTTIEKDKEYYFNQASLAAVDDAQFHFVLGQLFLEYYDRSDTSTFLKLVATEFEKCLLIDSSHNNKELWSTITAIYVDIHEEYQKKDLLEPFWFEELVYKRIIKLDPTNASAHNNLSFLYSQNGVNLKEALKEAQIANQLNPNNPYLMDSLGWAFYKNKQLTQAMDTLKKAAALKSDIADVHFHLATVYFDQDDFPNASREFRETIKLDPENAFAKNNLAYLFAEKGVELDEAQKLVDDALAKYPDNAAFIDTKGWIYFKQKKFDLAVENLRKAIELMPETSDLHLHLGTVFLTLARYQDAAQHFEKALTYDSGNPQIAKDLSFAYTLHGLQSSLERFQKISGVDRNKENFKVFHDLMAAVYQAKGDYAGAQAALEQYRRLQSNPEPAAEDAGEPGDEDTKPVPEPSPSPAASPAAATAPVTSTQTPAALMPADTDLYVVLERGLIGRLVDLGIERARTAGQRVVLPGGGMVAAAIERVTYGFSVRSIKSLTRGCGLLVIQLAPATAAALRGQLGMFGEGPRSMPGPMNMKIEVISSRYKNHVLFQVTIPQGTVHLTLVENLLVGACQKSDLVGAIDRHTEPGAGLQALPSYRKLSEALAGSHDLVLFCRPASEPTADIPVPPAVAGVLAKTEAFASGWGVGTGEVLSEQTIALPSSGATADELKAAFEAAAKALGDDVSARTQGRAKVQAEYVASEGVLKGTVKLSGASVLAGELYNLLRKQIGEIPGLR